MSPRCRRHFRLYCPDDNCKAETEKAKETKSGIRRDVNDRSSAVN